MRALFARLLGGPQPAPSVDEYLAASDAVIAAREAVRLANQVQFDTAIAAYNRAKSAFEVLNAQIVWTAEEDAV